MRLTRARTVTFRCATGHSDATPGFVDLAMLAGTERTDRPRGTKHRAVRSRQTLGVGGHTARWRVDEDNPAPESTHVFTEEDSMEACPVCNHHQ